VVGYNVPIKLSIGGTTPSIKSARKIESQAVTVVMQPVKSWQNPEPLMDKDGDPVLVSVPFENIEKISWTSAKHILASGIAGGGNPFAGAVDWSSLAGAAEREAFFDPANNAVIRSFESAGGQGVAGVITQLGFDWNEAPWEINDGSRAPMWCKVTLGFTPIHDIPLGIDYQGGMRAPAYNVGAANHNLFGRGPYQKINVDDEGLKQAAKDFTEAIEARAEEKTFWEKIGGKFKKNEKE